MHPRLALSAALALALTAASGCDFFKELESLPGAEETGSDGDADADAGSDTGDGEPCTLLDDYCADQDTVRSCDVASGELVTLDCAGLCGSSRLNFTCIPTETFQHMCWCVTPGQYKNKSCTDLEACIVSCGDPNSSCAAGCFEDTTYQTVRLLGALYSCADRSCDDLCALSPGDCSSCFQAALAGLWGDCGVERSVCDADKTDEPSWP